MKCDPHALKAAAALVVLGKREDALPAQADRRQRLRNPVVVALRGLQWAADAASGGPLRLTGSVRGPGRTRIAFTCMNAILLLKALVWRRPLGTVAETVKSLSSEEGDILNGALKDEPDWSRLVHLIV
jgi:hypothetical protein